MLLLIQYTVIFAAILSLVALGGCFSEHSGIINLGLEGIMVIGAMGGALLMRFIPGGIPPIMVVMLVILISIIAGMIYSCLLAVSAIHCKADQTIIGTAMNLLGTAMATVIVKAINLSINPDDPSSTVQYVTQKQFFLTKIGNFEFNWFIVVAAITLIASYVVLYKTRFGLRLCACGEHPQAADSVGINVYKMRWSGVLISGFLGGVGGMAYIVPAVGDWNFEMGVAGMGFLAMAVMIFGQWKPLNIAAAAVFFAVFRAMANIFDSFAFLNALNWPKEIYNMMPFIASMIVLAFTSKRSRAPKAEGIPYDKGSR